MIRFIPRTRINRAKWDACVEGSTAPRVYAYCWYLDIIHPGWAALVADDYQAVFPLPIKRKYGIPYLSQPPFCQQLGLFIKEEANHTLASFLSAIPKSILKGEIQLHSLSQLPYRILASRGSFAYKERANYELPLNLPYASLARSYSTNTRRNLQKAQSKGFYLAFELRPSELISFKQENEKTSISPLSYQKIQRVMHYALRHELGYLVGVYSPSGNSLLAACFLLKGPHQWVYLLAASSETGRKERAMFYLVDQLIQKHAGSPMSLDFEGSDIPGLARFYQGFGAENKPYPQLRINRLPSWLPKSLLS